MTIIIAPVTVNPVDSAEKSYRRVGMYMGFPIKTFGFTVQCLDKNIRRIATNSDELLQSISSRMSPLVTLDYSDAFIDVLLDQGLKACDVHQTIADFMEKMTTEFKLQLAAAADFFVRNKVRGTSVELTCKLYVNHHGKPSYQIDNPYAKPHPASSTSRHLITFHPQKAKVDDTRLCFRE